MQVRIKKLFLRAGSEEQIAVYSITLSDQEQRERADERRRKGSPDRGCQGRRVVHRRRVHVWGLEILWVYVWCWGEAEGWPKTYVRCLQGLWVTGCREAEHLTFFHRHFLWPCQMYHEIFTVKPALRDHILLNSLFVTDTHAFKSHTCLLSSVMSSLTRNGVQLGKLVSFF